MRWANQETRNLLRLMRRPHALERERLAVMLREATRAPDARYALQQIIESTFDKSIAADRLRYAIIQRCDVGGETTRSAATALGLSVRQFFRVRADAIAALAEAIERRLRQPPDAHDDLERLAQTLEMVDSKAALDIYLRLPPGTREETPYDIVRTSIWAGLDVTQEQLDACEGPWRLLAYAALSRNLVWRGDVDGALALIERVRDEMQGKKGARYEPVAFEIAFLERCDATRTGDIHRSRALLDELRALAGQDETRQAMTLLFEADQASIEGDARAAATAIDDLERLDVRNRDLTVMARTALAKAMLALVQGRYGEAYALANGASQGMAWLEAAFSWRAAGIAGRAALFSGSRWTPPQSLNSRYPNVWTRSLAEAVRARHLLPGAPREAREAAELALEIAQKQHCPSYAAYAKVSLAGALDALGEHEAARELRVEAWESEVRRDDRFALYDLFYNPHAKIRDLNAMFDQRFGAAIMRYLEDVAPVFADLRRRASGEAVAGVARYCLELGLGNPKPHGDLELIGKPLAERLAGGYDDAIVLRTHCGALGHIAAKALSWCVVPAERERFVQRFVEAWVEGGERARLAICPELAAWREAV